jgi:hypothetical protein
MSVLLRAFSRGLLASRALGVELRAEAAPACRLLTGSSSSAPASPAAVAGSMFRSFARSASSYTSAFMQPKLYVTNM